MTKDLLFRIKTHNNPDLLDEARATKIIEAMISKYPEIHDYQFEIDDDKNILLLIWGDL